MTALPSVAQPTPMAPGSDSPPPVTPSLYGYIWRHSARAQAVILALTVASFPLLYLLLELPKIIINQALALPAAPRDLFGLTLDPIPFLVLLCSSFLGLVLVNGALKMVINTRVGIVGERMVRRLRYELVERLLRFPLARFQRLSQGEVISTVTAETEPLAGFIGDSLALPLFQGGTMLTILVFLFVQDPILGLASIALIPIQAWLIPKLQRRINRLGKERVRLVRRLAERLGEGVSGVREIRQHGTQRRQLAEYSHWLGAIYRVRLQIFRKKFFMKFINNLLGQVTPFLFFLVGGILVLQGSLTFGALVAALAAYKDLTAPWKELLNYYQRQADARIKFAQILEMFGVDDAERNGPGPAPESAPTTPNPRPGATAGAPSRIEGDLVVEGVGATATTGTRMFSAVALTLPPGTRVLIRSETASHRQRLAEILSGATPPDGGRVTLGGRDLATLDPDALGLSIGAVGPDPVLFTGSLFDNVVLPLRRHPPGSGDSEAMATGNSPDAFEGEWLDPGVVGLPDREAVSDWWLRILTVIGADAVVYRSGLRDRLDPARDTAFAEALVAARSDVRARLAAADGAGDDIHVLGPEAFNPAFTLAENILYGTAADDRLGGRAISRHDFMGKVFRDSGLVPNLRGMAATLCRRLLDVAEARGELLAQYEFLDDAAVEYLQSLAPKVVRHEFDDLTPDGRRFLGWLLLSQAPARHRLGVVDDAVIAAVLEARRIFREQRPPELADAVVPFDLTRAHPALTVLETLLFGRVAEERPGARERIEALVTEVVDARDLRRPIMLHLAQSEVGIAGSRIPPIARHRIGLGRSLIKKPSVLVFHDALGPFNRASQASTLERIRTLLPNTTLIWIDQTGDGLPDFDRDLTLTARGVVPTADGVDSQATPEPPPTQVGQPKAGAITVGEIGATAAALADIPILAGLAQADLTLLAGTAQRLTLAPGTALYTPGAEARHAYALLSGSVRTAESPGGGLPAPVILAPALVGLDDIVLDNPRRSGLLAHTAAVVLALDAAALRDLLSRDAALSLRLLRSTLADRSPMPPAPASAAGAEP